MSKGTITVIIDPKTGRTDVDIDLPDAECEKLDPEIEAMLGMLGVEGGKRTYKETPPGQLDGNPDKQKDGTGGGGGS